MIYLCFRFLDNWKNLFCTMLVVNDWQWMFISFCYHDKTYRIGILAIVQTASNVIWIYINYSIKKMAQMWHCIKNKFIISEDFNTHVDSNAKPVTLPTFWINSRSHHNERLSWPPNYSTNNFFSAVECRLNTERPMVTHKEVTADIEYQHQTNWTI